MPEPSETARARLRELPSVDRLATAVARAELADRRAALLAGADDDPDLVAAARRRLRPSLRPVLNATGVVIHTNLGRAPLAHAARRAVDATARGYSNLELDLETGERGSRHEHVDALLRELTGAEAAVAVNNCAAATLLAVAALAAPHGEVIVSRGQLVEIGGGFRIPDVIAQAGARLVEVGTTNRTRAADYDAAIGPETRAVLRGAPVELPPHRLRGGGRDRGAVRAARPGDRRRRLRRPARRHAAARGRAAGAALRAGGRGARDVLGRQAARRPAGGVLVGRADAVAACRRHPLARATRIDKLSLAALEATLMLYRDPVTARRELPVLAMLDADPATLGRRARRLADAAGGTVVQAVARVGGGALPLLELHGPAVALDAGPAGADALAAALRRGEPSVVARIEDGRVLLDPRTLPDDAIEPAAAAVRAAVG